jgi:hypothetical protein
MNPYLLAEKQIKVILPYPLNRLPVTITKVVEKNIDQSDHNLREKILDWYAHYAINKRCQLIGFCNDLVEFSEWNRWTCVKCIFKDTKETKCKKKNLVQRKFSRKWPTKTSRRLAFQNNKFKIEDLKRKHPLVYLKKYSPCGFSSETWRTRESRNDRLVSLLFDTSEEETLDEISEFEIE